MPTHGFSMSRQQVQAFAAKYQYAMMMLHGAGDDYTAARCLILNGLPSGFPLMSQALEKLLKACIYLETGHRTTLKRQDLHNPYSLKQELKSIKDYGLDKFDALLNRLYGHFQTRYFDSSGQSKGMYFSELEEFDEVWMYLLQRAPFPAEVKYRAKFFAMLCSEQALEHWPQYRHWTTNGNKALAAELKNMDEAYAAVKKHLYS